MRIVSWIVTERNSPPAESLIESEITPALIKLLASPNNGVCEQALATLGNFRFYELINELCKECVFVFAI